MVYYTLHISSANCQKSRWKVYVDEKPTFLKEALNNFYFKELICLRAIRDVNVPKFLQDDLKLFNGIVSDLFPKIKEQPIDYGALDDSIRKSCLSLNIEDVDGFVTKCIQLFETTVVRHGLMLVGPTGSGKTKVFLRQLRHLVC